MSFPDFVEYLGKKFSQEDVEKAIKTKRIEIDLEDLFKYNSSLCEEMITKPDDYLFRGSLAIQELEPAFHFDENDYPININFTKVPQQVISPLRSVGFKEVGRLVAISGLITLLSERKTEVYKGNFKCVNCDREWFQKTYENRLIKYNACPKCHKNNGVVYSPAKNKWKDVQYGVIQETFEEYLDEYEPRTIVFHLHDTLVDRIKQGKKYRLIGVMRVREPMAGRKIIETVMERYFDVYGFEELEEDYKKILILPEEIEKFKEISQREDIAQEIVKMMSPSILGYEIQKYSIALQMFGGSSVTDKITGTKSRGTIGILLIGDPSCLDGDTLVALGDGTFDRIKNFGEKHLQKLNQQILVGCGGNRDVATVFHKFENQPTLKITTESGKIIIGTFNHPLRVVEKGEGGVNPKIFVWKRLDELKVGDRLQVTTGVKCNKKSLVKLKWMPRKNNLGPKRKILLPEYLNEDLGGLFGYLLGDGYLHNKYAFSMVVNESEKDLIKKLQEKLKNLFGIEAKIKIRTAKEMNKHRSGDSKFGKHKQSITVLDFCSVDFAQSFNFIREKIVPTEIFQSNDKVVSEFLAWLFEADGCVFSKGRGCHAIQLKASIKRLELLREIQTLLLRFSIHSRIIEWKNTANLVIRRAESIRKFSENIGFRSNKKIARLQNLIERRKNSHHEFGGQRSERIVSIEFAGIRDVYDIEVPKSHRFIANGVISHNSGKSVLAFDAKKMTPKSMLVVGKGVTSAGLGAAAVKESYGIGKDNWVVKAGALVLASGSTLVIDELDKVPDQDKTMLHSAMEQQVVKIDKAGLHAEFCAETSILACANPKLSRFDPENPDLARQFNISTSLLTRFDLIFVFRDIANENKDRKIAEFITEKYENNDKREEMLFTPKELQKYIAYARTNFNPTLSEEAQEIINSHYTKLRLLSQEKKYYNITARFCEATIRLSQAVAKLHYSNVVTKEHAKTAIFVMLNSLRGLVVDDEFLKAEGFEGKIDGIQVGELPDIIPLEQKDKLLIINRVFNDLKNKETGLVDMEDLSEALVSNYPEHFPSLASVDKELQKSSFGDTVKVVQGRYLKSISGR